MTVVREERLIAAKNIKCWRIWLCNIGVIATCCPRPDIGIGPENVRHPLISQRVLPHTRQTPQGMHKCNLKSDSA